METGIDYNNVDADDLEMMRQSKCAMFRVYHAPTGTLSSVPYMPGTDPPIEARYHSTQTLPPGLGQKGIVGWITDLNPSDNPDTPAATYAITVRGGNEYLNALADDPDILKLTFEGRPKQVRLRRKKATHTKTVVPELTAEEAEAILRELDAVM